MVDRSMHGRSWLRNEDARDTCLHVGEDFDLCCSMAERQQLVLPAKCSRCELKLKVLVPKQLMKDPDAARSYLLSKFDEHSCSFGDGQTGTRW